MKRIGNKSSKHLYEVGTTAGRIEVDANSAAQARKIAEQHGYTVRDVNMVG